MISGYWSVWHFYRFIGSWWLIKVLMIIQQLSTDWQLIGDKEVSAGVPNGEFPEILITKCRSRFYCIWFFSRAEDFENWREGRKGPSKLGKKCSRRKVHMYDIVKYIINYKPDILNGLPVTHRSWHSNIVKYIINYKPDILNGLSQSHIGLDILTLLTRNTYLLYLYFSVLLFMICMQKMSIWSPWTSVYVLNQTIVK
jgi:hypothetical protein